MGISIVVPVGPQPEYLSFLKECLLSIKGQMTDQDQIVIIDDMSSLDTPSLFVEHISSILEEDTYKYVRNHWLSGCSHSWNFGVSLADNEWCILMGSDDKLLPGCLDACRKVIEGKHDKQGFYNLKCITSEEEVIGLHNNAALVSKSLWNLTGGFPVSAALGAPDALLISIMIKNLPQHLHQVPGPDPYYWVRVHPNQDTGRMAGLFHGEVLTIRDRETARWTPPKWTKKE